MTAEEGQKLLDELEKETKGYVGWGWSSSRTILPYELDRLIARISPFVTPEFTLELNSMDKGITYAQDIWLILEFVVDGLYISWLQSGKCRAA